MKHLCAWCRKEITESATSDAADSHEITHGICDDCLSNIEFQQGVSLLRFIDSLREPVMVRDESGEIQLLNRAAAEILGIDRTTFIGGMPGQIFECQHARYPQGCGHTVHCSGCALRLAIQQTAETGKGVNRVPASLSHEDETTRLLITTEKLGRVVLLRIDNVSPDRPRKPSAGQQENGPDVGSPHDSDNASELPYPRPKPRF